MTQAIKKAAETKRNEMEELQGFYQNLKSQAVAEVLQMDPNPTRRRCCLQPASIALPFLLPWLMDSVYMFICVCVRAHVCVCMSVVLLLFPERGVLIPDDRNLRRPAFTHCKITASR